MFRRILLIEQFKNENMSRIFKEFFIDYPIYSQKLIFQELMDHGVMVKNDAEVLAKELYSPVFMYHISKENREDELICVDQ